MGDMASGRDNKLATDRFATQPQTSSGLKPSSTIPKEVEVWVKKWVDYSSKYGLGYYLSNEATGVFYNDSTKVVLDPNGFHFDYMERRSSDR
jgi:polo-like kinase 1